MAVEKFKLTYATMYNPPEALHSDYENALTDVKAHLGREYSMIIDGKDVSAKDKFEDRSPIDTDVVLGVFQKGAAEDAHKALRAARKAAPMWRRTKWQDRIAIIRKAADLMDERIYKHAAALSLEVGKNRMEALGDLAEASDLLRYPCDGIEKNNGYVVQNLNDPLVGYVSTNHSYLLPYGVWLVISPFNFPGALTCGPLAAALVAGNTTVVKPASDTPWSVRYLIECLRDAGLPDGVCNFITGPGSTLGQALIESHEVDGITFTGSRDVGMGIYRDYAKSAYARPIILELGGKNPAIVSRRADLETAAQGIVRSAFGLQGQKCSACSRVYVEESLYEALCARVVELTNKLAIGDPTERTVFLGPVVNKTSYKEYQEHVAELHKHSRVLTGGKVLTDGIMAKGYFCAPTIAADLPLDHYIWKHELFLPITTITSVKNLDEGMKLANNSAYGLTAGFYGAEDELDWFFDHIEAGTTYANRPQGATAGAWPGFQTFGGWKASGASGKNAFGPYYLSLYMHEQSRTIVRKA